jgi:predicted kinase
MRQCEFFVETTSGKFDTRTHQVEALVDGVWTTVRRGVELARLERRYGVLEMRIDGEPAESHEGQQSRHLRETSEIAQAFLEPGGVRSVVERLGGIQASEYLETLRAVEDGVRGGTWEDARAAIEEGCEKWIKLCQDVQDALPHADTSFANRLRAFGAENTEADVLAFAMRDVAAGDGAERAGARAAVGVLTAGGSTSDAYNAARRVMYLLGAERDWGASLGTEFQSGVVPQGGLVLLSGEAGSGKSTHAKRLADTAKNVVIVSTDGIRKELLGSEADQSRGDEVFRERDRRVRQGLRNGQTVIVDATNLDRSVSKLFQFAREHERMVSVVRMDTPVERVLEQNLGRERVVPEEAVLRHVARHREMTDEVWRTKGARHVCSVAEALQLGDVPPSGAPCRVTTSADISELIRYGGASEISDGVFRVQSPWRTPLGERRESFVARSSDGVRYELSES